MTDFGPSLTTSLSDRIIYEYGVLPFNSAPFTTAQLLALAQNDVTCLFDPSGANLIIPTPSGKEQFNRTQVQWRTVCAAALQNTVTGTQVLWNGVDLKAWGNLAGPSINIDGESPPLVQIHPFDEYNFPRVCQNISIPKFQTQSAFDFNSMTDPVNVIPDPAGPHVLYVSLFARVVLWKK